MTKSPTPIRACITPGATARVACRVSTGSALELFAKVFRKDTLRAHMHMPGGTHYCENAKTIFELLMCPLHPKLWRLTTVSHFLRRALNSTKSNSHVRIWTIAKPQTSNLYNMLN
eukprot:4416902-Amphidinium_carterae.1